MKLPQEVLRKVSHCKITKLREAVEDFTGIIASTEKVRNPLAYRMMS